jgi:hypothetical protein
VDLEHEDTGRGRLRIISLVLDPGHDEIRIRPADDAWCAAAAEVRFIVWCRDCRHQVEPDPAEMGNRYGPETTVPDWHKWLVCSRCRSHETDMVVTGERR